MLQKAFHELGVKTDVRPDSELVDLLPVRNRRTFWQSLSENSGLKLPELVRPGWLVLLCCVLVLFGSWWFSVYVQLEVNSSFVSIFCLFVALVGGGTALSMVTVPFATKPGSEWQDTKNLSEVVLAENARFLLHIGYVWTTDSVWIVLRTIVEQSYGLDSGEVTEKTSFAKDLDL